MATVNQEFTVGEFEHWYGCNGCEITTPQEASQAAIDFWVESVQIMFKSIGSETFWRIQFGSGFPIIGEELGPTLLASLKAHFRAS